jgi:Xaa-Pro aminopeptidase
MVTEIPSDDLKRDLDRRVRALQEAMRAQDVAVTLTVATGAPSQTGWLRYFTGADLWQDQAFVLIDAQRADPLIIVDTVDVADAVRQTAPTARAESAQERETTAIERVIEVVRETTGGRGRMGTIATLAQLRYRDAASLRAGLPGLEPVDLTDFGHRLRLVKSPFEIAAMREMGVLLHRGLELFEDGARVGVNASALAGEIEGFLRGRGCYWGTSKYSLDERPYLIPFPPGHRFARDDVVVFEFVYSGPLGYWYILSSLYSFGPLPRDTERRLQATVEAMQETARISVPGATRSMMDEMPDRVFRAHGFTVAGKHTLECHPIGLDINDGPRDLPPDWTLRDGMTLALHPATLPEGGLGYFLCDVFLVQRDGAVPLSPRTSFYRRLGS